MNQNERLWAFLKEAGYRFIPWPPVYHSWADDWFLSMSMNGPR